MTDESGEDAKVLAVPADKLSRAYRHIKELDDLSELLRNQITHFFEHYKDLEPSKWVKIEGWGGSEEAKQEIESSVKRYNDSPEKPAF